MLAQSHHRLTYNQEDLAVHKRKVQDVRHWLLEAFGNDPSGKLKKYRVSPGWILQDRKRDPNPSYQRILVLTGPAGTAKTATMHVLSNELGFDILEWRNTMDEQFSRSDGDWNGIEY